MNKDDNVELLDDEQNDIESLENPTEELDIPLTDTSKENDLSTNTIVNSNENNNSVEELLEPQEIDVLDDNFNTSNNTEEHLNNIKDDFNNVEEIIEDIDNKPNNIENIRTIDNNSSIPMETANTNKNDIVDNNFYVQDTRDMNTEKKPDKHDTYKINKGKYVSYLERLIIKSAVCFISFVIFISFVMGYILVKKDKSYYTENSTVNYQVCLDKNNYYKEKCLGEDNEYITSITKNITIDFGYNVTYQENVTKKYKYYVKSILYVKTDDESAKELLKKEKKLSEKNIIEVNGKDNSTVGVISVPGIELPFKKYEEYAQKYKNDYSLISNCYVVVSLIVNDGKGEKAVSSITVPLTKSTYNITKEQLENKTTDYTIKSNAILKIVFIVLAILSFLGLIYNFKKLLNFILLSSKKSSNYEKQLRQILNTYDRVIISLEDKNSIVNDTEIYTVKSFLELLDVRDTIDKPILYYRVNSIKTEFYVQDVNKTYKFTLKDMDDDEKK